MILITAPTGKIGSRLTAELLSSGQPLRLLTRDPTKLAREVSAKAEIVQGSMGDPDVLDRALRGVSALFWLVPSPATAPDVRDYYLDFTRPAAQAVRTHGVTRVVTVSSLYRGTDRPTGPGFAVNAMDEAFSDTGAAYRALWSANHMENTARQVATLRQGFFSLPVEPQVRMPLVATRDVATVAATLLLDRGWAGQGGIPVMGPEDLSHDEMAVIMSEVLGRPIAFRPTSKDDFVSGMEARGASHGVSQWLADMFEQGAADPYGSATAASREDTPTTFRQWCLEVLKPMVLT